MSKQTVESVTLSESQRIVLWKLVDGAWLSHSSGYWRVISPGNTGQDLTDAFVDDLYGRGLIERASAFHGGISAKGRKALTVAAAGEA